MDPALLKEREAFKKRAWANPTVEKSRRTKPESAKPSKKKRKISAKPTTSTNDQNEKFNYKSMSGSSKYKFGVLAKIVNYMKVRHQRGDTHALTIEEILDETNQLDVVHKLKSWLTNEALCNNPKIRWVDEDGETKYLFRSKFQLRGWKDLRRLLSKYDQEGLGGILIDDIEESLPNAHKSIKKLSDEGEIIIVTRPIDKKQVLFYNDKTLTMEFQVNEEFQKLWRSVPVSSIDQEKIQEYLNKQGMSSLADTRLPAPQKRKKPAVRKARKFKSLNTHMGDVLKDFSQDGAK